MLKYQPKHFWSMLQSRDDDTSALKLKDCKEHIRTLFQNPNIPDDEYTPVPNPTIQDITPAELTHTI
jgi:hypothetical protein